MTTNKEYLRDWPAADDARLKNNQLASLERLAQGLLTHGVGLSVRLENQHEAAFLFTRYTSDGEGIRVRATAEYAPRNGGGPDEVKALVRSLYGDTSRYYSDGVSSAWTAWPEDGDARFGDEDEEDEEYEEDAGE